MTKENLGYHCLSFATTGSESRGVDVIGGDGHPIVGGIRVGANDTAAIVGAVVIAGSFIALSWIRSPSKSGGA